MEKMVHENTEKNGLSQTSILSGILFNIYVNGLPVEDDYQLFVYVDDFAINLLSLEWSTH